MSEISQRLLWCVLQVTVVCAVATFLCAAMRRWKPGSQSRVSLAALVVVLCLTAISLSPWPSWVSAPQQTVRAIPSRAVTGPVVAESESVSGGANAAISTDRQTSERAKTSKETAETSAPESIFERSARFVLPVVVLSILVGAVRFMLGWRTIRRVSREAQPLQETNLLTEVESLRQALGCRPQLTVKESTAIGTPATIGWLQPIILLPTEWRSWTAEERRAVLAHEIAHIAGNDFRRMVLAQFSTVFHFYHPLVHALVARLRLEQEISADAAASRVTGGQHTYLTTLAEMALRHDNQAVAWPARPFLPMSSDLLRRIDMLKNPHPVERKGVIATRLAAVAVILLAGLVAVGLRPENSLAQSDDKPLPSSSSIRGAFALRTSMNNLKQIALAMHNYHDTYKAFPPAVLTSEEGHEYSWRVAILPYIDQVALYESYRFDEPWDGPNNKKIMETMPDVFRSPSAAKDSNESSYYVLVGENSAFADGDGRKIREFTDGTSNTLLVLEAKRDIPWSKPADIEYKGDQEMPKLGGWYRDGFPSAFADGSARFMSSKISDETMHNVIRINDGNVVTSEELSPRGRR